MYFFLCLNGNDWFIFKLAKIGYGQTKRKWYNKKQKVNSKEKGERNMNKHLESLGALEREREVYFAQRIKKKKAKAREKIKSDEN